MAGSTRRGNALSRRRVLQGAAATGFVAVTPALAAPRTDKPNILFILADDLGFADLSCYGRRDYSTPVIDRLAADGLRLTQAYSNSANCTPTRVGLITGRYQQRLAVGLNEPLRGHERDAGLPPGHPTLPSVLRDAGYATALVGKWHIGFPARHGPLRAGYQRFFGIVTGAADYASHRSHGFPQGRDKPFWSAHALYEGDDEVKRPGYLTDVLAERAIDEIHRFARADGPFFLSLHFNAPHWPWQGPRDASLPEEVTQPDVVSTLRHDDGGSLEKFAEMVGAMDAAIGRVLAALDEAGAARDTIVVFTSDNGGERFSDVWPLRGGKGELLEGGIRVPAIVRWPARIRAGAVSDQAMMSMDWLPTLAAAANAPLDARFAPDGTDLLDVLTGASPSRARKLFWRFRSKGQAAVRDGRWKYLKMEDGEWLFDIPADPRERADLKHREKPVFERLRADWEAWNRTMLPYPPPPPTQTS